MKEHGIRHLQSITFWKLFLSYTLLSLAIAFGALFYSQHKNLMESKQRTDEQSQATISAIQASLDSILSDEMIVAMRLNDLAWVQKLYANFEAFDRGLTLISKLQLTENYLLFTDGVRLEKRIFLVFPYRDICISHKAWVNVRDYFGMLNVPADQREALLAEIKEASGLTRLGTRQGTQLENAVTLCIPLEKIRHPRACAVFILSADKLEKMVRRQITGALCGVRILDASTGETLLTVANGETPKAVEMETRGSAYIDWKYVFALDPSVYRVVYTASQGNSLLFGIALFVGSTLFSYLLAYLSYLPIGRLASKAGNGKPGHAMVKDYQLIGQSLDALRLRQEEDRRYNALHRLLSGYFRDNSEEFAQCGLRFTDSMWYQAYLIADLDQAPLDGLPALAEALKDIEADYASVVCEGVELENHAFALITAYRDEQEAQRLDHEIQRRLSSCAGSIYVGQISQGLIGASIAYQSASDKHVHSAGAVRYYFPLEWEKQLITALRAGSADSARYICAKLRQENDRRWQSGEAERSDMLHLLSTLVNDIQRVATETDMQEVLPADLNAFAGRRMSEIWDEIDRMCALLCEHLRGANALEDETVSRILRFTEENFARHDLCLKTLETHFSLSSGTLNKCFKAGANSTFYAYLTRLRMEYACGLLKAGGLSIADVADRSGYDNEYSFRRVFQRTLGVKAQDYAASQLQLRTSREEE